MRGDGCRVPIRLLVEQRRVVAATIGLDDDAAGEQEVDATDPVLVVADVHLGSGLGERVLLDQGAEASLELACGGDVVAGSLVEEHAHHPGPGATALGEVEEDVPEPIDRREPVRE